ncbi:AAA family ATPase, partial [Escherichia coli]
MQFPFVGEKARLYGKRLVRTVLIFTESSDQLSRATDRVPG